MIDNDWQARSFLRQDWIFMLGGSPLMLLLFPFISTFIGPESYIR
jgi:hypothetical protein